MRYHFNQWLGIFALVSLLSSCEEDLGDRFVEDSTSPTISNPLLSFSEVNDQSILISWSAAKDSQYDSTELLYGLYISDKILLDSLETIEGSGTLVGGEFQKNITALKLVSLEPNTTIYFNLVVKDPSGNKAVYQAAAQHTLSDGDPGTWLTNNTANGLKIVMHPWRQAISIEMDANTWSKWNSDLGFSETVELQKLTSTIYGLFKDNFDFVVLISNNEEAPAVFPYSGKFLNTRNDIRGIGLETFNNNSQFGANNRLQGLIHLVQNNYLENGPFLHELMHNWGNYILDTKGIISGKEYDFKPHWGVSNIGGQLGGFEASTLVQAGQDQYKAGINGNEFFGTFGNGGNVVPYSDFELYLMGLKSAAEVQDPMLFEGLTNLNLNTGSFKASSVKTLDMNSIVTANGMRSPQPTQSQREFKILTVMLTPAPLSGQEWFNFNQQIERFTRNASDQQSWTYNFYEATGRQATLKANDIFSDIK